MCGVCMGVCAEHGADGVGAACLSAVARPVAGGGVAMGTWHAHVARLCSLYVERATRHHSCRPAGRVSRGGHWNELRRKEGRWGKRVSG